MKPIIFNTEMVRAILDGRKTQTRRIIKLRDGSLPQDEEMSMDENGKVMLVMDFSKHYPQWEQRKCPYGIPGDELYVKETFGYDPFRKNKVVFKAGLDIDPDYPIKWKSARYMFKKFSRITLEIKDVRVERVQDIRIKHIQKEGIDGLYGFNDLQEFVKAGHDNSGNIFAGHYASQFIKLWDSINLKRGYGWDTNPYVFVIEFEHLKQ